MHRARLGRYGLLSVTGDDARDFLHAQLTNDIQGLAPDRAALAGWCSAQGRLLATFLVIPDLHGFSSLWIDSKSIGGMVGLELRQQVLLADYGVVKRFLDLFITIHLLSRSFPVYERYELGSQMRRAALSVAANIVEGYGRRTPRDRVHFLRIAAASLAEVGYYLHAANGLGTSRILRTQSLR